MMSPKKYSHLPRTDYIGEKPGPLHNLFSELDAETWRRTAMNPHSDDHGDCDPRKQPPKGPAK